MTIIYSDKTLSPLIQFMKEERISPKDALQVLKKEYEVNFDNMRVKWKMIRFTMYLWARIEEEKSGYLGKKSDTIRRLIRSKKYQNQYHAFAPSIQSQSQMQVMQNYEKHNPEAYFAIHYKQLNQLVTDPRQIIFFREKYFYYENKKINIPQEVIDRVR
jgi:hypothetical protein